jgi:glycosyltransferase involved in cell wall biosynthesis
VRVLVLSQVVPFPPDSGPKVKTWNLIKWLGARHEVTLAAFARGEPASVFDALRGHCTAVHTVPMVRSVLRDAWFLAVSLLSGKPWVIARDRREAMYALVARLAGTTAFDVVHVDQLNMAQYAAGVANAFTVLDAHNALWLLYRRLAATIPPGPRRLLLEREWRRLVTYEGEVGRSVDAILAVSSADRDALREVIGPHAPITVLPIAVDTDELEPIARRADADRVVHVGTLFWPPNAGGVRWFVETVWPRIRAARPDVRLDAVGARPPRALRALARPDNGVTFPGYVADPTAHLERAGAVVVPLLAGSGMRVRILTALAQALPVVSTTLGCEGLDVESGRHLLIADTPASFAEATLRLLDDRGLADELGRNGRRLIEARYDYRRVYPPLAGVYPQGESAPPAALTGRS